MEVYVLLLRDPLPMAFTPSSYCTRRLAGLSETCVLDGHVFWYSTVRTSLCVARMRSTSLGRRVVRGAYSLACRFAVWLACSLACRFVDWYTFRDVDLTYLWRGV